MDAEDLLDLGRNIDTLIDTNIDVDDTDEVENLVGEVETLISDVDSLVTDIGEFVDVVNNYAKKIVGIDRLQRMKRETRRFRRGQILQQYGAGLSVESHETNTETKEARHGMANKTQPDAPTEGDEVEEVGPALKDDALQSEVSEQSDKSGQDRRLPSETNSQSDRDRPGTDTSANTPETDSEITGSGDRVPRGFLADQVDTPVIDESSVDEPHGADQL